MFRIFLYGFLILLISSPLSAQISYSLEFEEAVKKGTRTKTGAPGNAYFQNSADYEIKAEINPETRHIQASEEIQYQNNSPDDLEQIVIRIYQDMYKRDIDIKRDFNLDDEELTDGVEIQYVVYNGDSLDLGGAHISRKGTNLFIKPESPLKSGQAAALAIGWSFYVPNGHTVRMGTYGKGDDHSYFLAYWYPQVAVYDDVYGWDTYDYTGLQEFYNGFGDFSVELTAPANYLVWATGSLQNPDQLLSETYLQKYQQAHSSDEVVKIVQKEDYKNGNITLSGENGKLRWKYAAEHVPDFSFAVSNYYLWDATSAVVDDSDRRVYVDACYKPQSGDFKEVAEFTKEIIEGLSTGLPGVPYPYPAMTIFNGEIGGGGMEFPMMVNDASVFFKAFTYGLTAHEVAHTYFPFYMGINERRYAWMDEGWASMLPYDLLDKRGFSMMNAGMDAASYQGFAGHEKERPLMTPSVELKGAAYGINSYGKPATAYNVLRDVMGKETFKKAMLAYIDAWNGKHPQPYDFFINFDNVAGEDLSWFWNPWFYETTQPDLALVNVESKGKNISLEVHNLGGLPVPIHVVVELKNGETIEIHETAAYWKSNDRFSYSERLVDKPKEVQLGLSWIPDVDRSNNKVKVKRKRK